MAVIRKRSALESRTRREMPTWLRRTIAWGPMTLAGLVLAMSGLSLLGSSVGVEDDVAEAKVLVAQEQQAAEDAQTALREARGAVVEQALDAVSFKRELADTETGRALLERALSGKGDDALVEAVSALDGELDLFHVALVSVSGQEYSWTAAFSTDSGDHGLLVWTTSSDGKVVSSEAVAAVHDPRLSDPLDDEG